MSNLFELYKGENGANCATIAKKTMRRPNILARPTVRKMSSVVLAATSSAGSPPGSGICVSPVECNSTLNSAKKQSFVSDERGEISHSEFIFGCAALGEILQKHQPVPVTDHIPFYDGPLVMRFGTDEDTSDMVDMIGVSRAELALTAYRTVLKNGQDVQLAFPDSSAFVTKAEGNNPIGKIRRSRKFQAVQEDDLPLSPTKSIKTKKRSRRRGIANRRRKGGIQLRYEQKEFHIEPCKTDVVVCAKETDVSTQLKTSLSSASYDAKDSDDDIIFDGELLNDAEKTLVDQVMLLCRQFITAIDYADSDWYKKLKLAIVFRLKQLMENVTNASVRRRELREQNEELRKHHQYFVERIQSKMCKYEYAENSVDEIMYVEDETMGMVAKKRGNCLYFNGGDGEIMNI